MAGHMRTITVTTAELLNVVSELLVTGYTPALVAAHEDPHGIRIVYLLIRDTDDARVEVHVSVASVGGEVPSLAAVSFPISRFEREIRDLFGVIPTDHPMPYRLVRHGHWPRGWYPMRSDAALDPAFDHHAGAYPFTPVAGAGVYEIPVGPVHAGMIEPGHFRFSVVGETILRMKARLWFVHRGIEQLFAGRTPAAGIELAERVSGDTSVGHAVAYCLAVEEALGIQVSARAQRQRAMLVELERLYNHVGDLGAMANDVGFGFANVHALRVREALLRINECTTGHRLLRGSVTVGHTHLKSWPDLTHLATIGEQVAELVHLTLDKGSIIDRFRGTATLSATAARDLGTLGYVARASGIDQDARRDHPFVLMPQSLSVVSDTGGDVLARYRVRVAEFHNSLDIIRELADNDDEENPTSPEPHPAGRRHSGIGVVEGWRGRITYRVEIAADGALTRVKIVDPSFFNWPALTVALADTIVPDFPLANKSFNQSYAGNDL